MSTRTPSRYECKGYIRSYESSRNGSRVILDQVSLAVFVMAGNSRATSLFLVSPDLNPTLLARNREQINYEGSQYANNETYSN